MKAEKLVTLFGNYCSLYQVKIIVENKDIIKDMMYK